MGCTASSLKNLDTAALAGGSQPHQQQRPPAKPGGAARVGPLQWAAWRGDARQLARLLRGADRAAIADRDSDGWTALHFAVKGGSAACVRLLLDAGADPNACTRAGATPLLWAAALGAGDVVAALLAAGAIPDCQGRTPLQHAKARLAAEEAAEAEAPFQRPAQALAGARLAVRLLWAAATGELPCTSEGTAQSGEVAAAAASELEKPALGLSATPAEPATPSLRSQSASACSLESAASAEGSDGSAAATAAAAAAGPAPPGGPQRECRLCMEQGELHALVPCGHRATCGPCTARLLLPGMMVAWVEQQGGAAAAPGGVAAAKCRCPICRAPVTASLRVFDC